MVEEKKTEKKKKKDKVEVVLERVYNVPLRKEWLKAPKYKRSKKAVNALREFISKHMKSDNVKIGKHANLHIWKHGIKNPPHHIKVKAIKDNKGLVNVELEGVKLKERVPSVLRKARAKLEKKPKKKEEKKGLEGEIKGEDKKSETKVSGPSEEKKAIEKEELKEIKKEKIEAPKQAPVPKTVEQRPNAPANK